MAVSQKENVETFKNFVNGKWVPSRDGATFEDENPALRGSNIAHVSVVDTGRRSRSSRRCRQCLSFVEANTAGRAPELHRRVLEIAEGVARRSGAHRHAGERQDDQGVARRSGFGSGRGQLPSESGCGVFRSFRAGLVPRHLDLGSISASGHCRHHQPVELPDECHESEGAAGLADGQHGCLQAGVVHAVVGSLHGAASGACRACRQASSTALRAWVRGSATSSWKIRACARSPSRARPKSARRSR